MKGNEKWKEGEEMEVTGERQTLGKKKEKSKMSRRGEMKL